MSYTIKGKVLRVGDSIAVTERMTKRAIVVETNDNPKYPQINEVEFTGDRCALLDGISPGWKIDHTGAGRHASPPPPPAGPDDDSLPF